MWILQNLNWSAKKKWLLHNMYIYIYTYTHSKGKNRFSIYMPFFKLLSLSKHAFVTITDILSMVEYSAELILNCTDELRLHKCNISKHTASIQTSSRIMKWFISGMNTGLSFHYTSFKTMQTRCMFSRRVIAHVPAATSYHC